MIQTKLAVMTRYALLAKVNLKYTCVNQKQNGSSTIVKKIYAVTTFTCSSELTNLTRLQNDYQVELDRSQDTETHCFA